MRKGLAMLFCIASAALVLYVYSDTKIVADTFVADYYIQNFLKDTYARNGVAAIYLNYRVFDSIFETLILLVSVTAVINFSWRRDDEK
ncbi:MAG TPA: hypothetical protein DCG38_05530 [Eubacteriaceae bacterium]|jgi:multicomponent Na+:H+ antiporter subunit B|nr:hypothetical protein [Eubacteriaceae bacterium]